MLEVVKVALTEIHEDPDNTRKHGARNLATIMESLKQFGQVEPLVVQTSSKKVIGGNGRLAGMRNLGWTECNVVYVDFDDAKAAALSMALNRSAELAEWDYEALAKTIGMIQDKVDLGALGWAPHELEPIMAATWTPPEPGELPAPPDQGKPISLTTEQRGVFEQALDKIHREHGEDISEGRAVELICGDYLAGA